MASGQSSEFGKKNCSHITELRTLNSDHYFLAHAIRLGAQGLGRTWPNPSVGCVLVKDGQVIAAARTADGGRPHAETQALDTAGARARGATAYVSLEPCAHHGQTPPCAQALIDAGVARVVIAATDPDSRVAGRGIAMLEAAGIIVTPPPLAGGGWEGGATNGGNAPPPLSTPSPSQLRWAPPSPAGGEGISAYSLLHNLNRGFFRHVSHGLPYVAMKIATSHDGKITDANSMSQWITGPAARADGHRLRAQFDAVVTGIGTVLVDNPQLNVRLPGLTHSSAVRVVCDRRLRLPLESKLLKSAEEQPVWVLTTTDAIEQAASHATELREAGVVLHAVEDLALEPMTILQTLGAAGITRVLIEAGALLSTAFLAAECVDTLYWYRAPTVIGNTGNAAVSALETSLTHATNAVEAEAMTIGPDRRERYELRSCLPD